MKALIVVAALASLGSGAHAQSKRYPAKPVDKDRAAEARSKLWDNALHPERASYADQVRIADSEIATRTDDAVKLGIEHATAAITGVPDRPDAYRVRGTGYAIQHDWAKCADDFASAEARGGKLDDQTRGAIRRLLGLCQARAGRLAAAEQTLATAASGGKDAELWMRLGETRIAMGKLDEAIEALRTGIDSADPTTLALINWMLATAYDRARAPAEAADAQRRAVAADRAYSTIVNPTFPLLQGETEYMLALAYGAEPARPEYSLVYFRRYLQVAKVGAWRKRAEEHVRELSTAQLPDLVEKRGAAPVEPEQLRPIIVKGMPAMRACLGKHDGLVLEVKITKVGPRTPETARDRPRLWAPAPGVGVSPQTDLDGTARPALDEAVRCVDALAGKLPLPEVKDRDAWYIAVFLVVSST